MSDGSARPSVETELARVPGVPKVPAVDALSNLVLQVNVEPSSFLLGDVAELIGVALWFGVIGGTAGAERLERETPTLMEEGTQTYRDFRVLVPVANLDHVAQLMRTADDLARQNDGEVVESADVVDAIVSRSADYDLTVIGATQEGLLQELVFGAIPEAVGERAANTVIMAKRNLGITSWLKRWLRWE